MKDDLQSNTSGNPTYEQNFIPSQKTKRSSAEQKIQAKTIKSYEAEDIEKYGINEPMREIIYTKIVRQEWPKTCIISEETKTTE